MSLNARNEKALADIFQEEKLNVDLLYGAISEDMKDDGTAYADLQGFYINPEGEDDNTKDYILISKVDNGYHITTAKDSLSFESRNIIEEKQKGFLTRLSLYGIIFPQRVKKIINIVGIDCVGQNVTLTP